MGASEPILIFIIHSYDCITPKLKVYIVCYDEFMEKYSSPEIKNVHTVEESNDEWA